MDPSNGSNGSNGSDPDVHRGGLKEGLFGADPFFQRSSIFFGKSVFFSTKPIFFLQIISPLLCFLSPKFEN